MPTLARDQDKQEIIRRLRTLRPDSVRVWGRMSVHQMVCHVSDAFRMANGDKTTQDVSNLGRRTVVKWIALHMPVRWPQGRIQTVPEVDQNAGGTKPVEFFADLAELETLIERFVSHRGNRPAHPIFGRLSDSEWLRWGYLHTDHHLRQFGA
jgi:hypothetical protein